LVKPKAAVWRAAHQRAIAGKNPAGGRLILKVLPAPGFATKVGKTRRL